jgi:hypothetical protein
MQLLKDLGTAILWIGLLVAAIYGIGAFGAALGLV